MVGNVKFLDSPNYFPMALSKLPKAFGFTELKKGYFPYLFSTVDKQNYIGLIPPLEYYDPDNAKDEREELMKWHADKVAKNYVFHFQREIEEYCISDVDILTESCLKFRDLLISETHRDTPLKKDTSETLDLRYEATTAKKDGLKSLGYDVIDMWECDFKRRLGDNKELQKYFENHPLVLQTPLNPRDAFYGGRTGNTFEYYKAQNDEKLEYVDVCSLYPWVYEYGKFPVGHPKVYVGSECPTLSSVSGLIRCKVLPPRELFHPVLPAKMNNKLMFVLCRDCGQNLNFDDCRHSDEERSLIGTWTVDEVPKAIDKGYEVLEKYEIWAYDTVQFGEDVTAEFFRMMSNLTIYVNTLLPVNEDTLIVNWKYKEKASDSLSTVNVVIAAFVTAQARLKLYSYLEQLEERVLYYDTDSVIYVSEPGEFDIPTGEFVGDMTNELEKKGHHSYITEFVSGGPKNYSYTLWSTKDLEHKTVCKVKGISMNHSASQLINVNKYMILTPCDNIYIVNKQIRRTQKREDYRLKTVTYDLTPFPYLAINTIRQLAEEYRYESPPVAGILENYIFVDDIVSGSHSLPEALKLQTDMIRILDKGGFELRKWASNSLEFLSNLPASSLQLQPLGLDPEPDSVIKMLGLQWNPVSDSFSYEVEPLNKPCTKRSILSELARIYDPLGFLIFAYTDFTTALAWIQSSPHEWTGFVSNRVTEIQDNVPPIHWHHVASEDNPADPASRGLLPSELLTNYLWWAGPSWLREPEDGWPLAILQSSQFFDTKEEKQKNVCIAMVETEPLQRL
ncbi:hypothetical protein JTB14_015426 [Gonioctena quinquepunctata]|nr:hypothetical protein JTB14_015426 [Gonioctena quinquepunctata]